MGKDDLVEALFGKDVKKAQTAIEAGADVNGSDKYGRTPLVLAITRAKSKAMVKLLVEKGADVKAYGKDDQGLNPILALAEALRDVQLLELMIAKGAGVNDKDKKKYSGRTALHRAVRGRDLAFAEALVKAGADIEVKDDENGDTPLHWACRSESGVLNQYEEAGARWLMKQGANIHAVNENDETPLHRAAGSGGMAIVKELLAAGAKITRTAQGSTPICFTMHTKDNNVPLWDLLVAAGDGKDEPTDDGATPLTNALMFSCKPGVKYLIAKGADPNRKGSDGKSPIDNARERGNKEMLAILEAGGGKMVAKKPAPAPVAKQTAPTKTVAKAKKK